MKRKSIRIIRTLWVALPVLSLFLMVIYACNKAKNTQSLSSQDPTTTLIASDTLENGIILPLGTQISVHPDKPKTMHVVFPAQYRFIGITSSLVPVELSSFDITCTCDKGSEGCSPYTNPKASGCVTTGNCTTCTQKNSFSAEGEDEDLGEGAVIDLSSGIHFITSSSEVQALPAAYASLFMDSTVMQSLRSFMKGRGAGEAFAIADTSSSGVLPAGYVYLPLSIYGRSLLVPVKQAVVPVIAGLDYTPSKKMADQEDLQEQQAFSGYSCSCSSGSGCTKYAYYIPFLGMNYFCKAGGCLSCTLHTPQ